MARQNDPRTSIRWDVEHWGPDPASKRPPEAKPVCGECDCEWSMHRPTWKVLVVDRQFIYTDDDKPDKVIETRARVPIQGTCMTVYYDMRCSCRWYEPKGIYVGFERRGFDRG